MGEESASRWDGGRRKKHIEFPSPCFWLLLAPFEVRIWFRSNLEIQRIFNSGKEARSKRLKVALQRLVKKEKKKLERTRRHRKTRRRRRRRSPRARDRSEENFNCAFCSAAACCSLLAAICSCCFLLAAICSCFMLLAAW